MDSVYKSAAKARRNGETTTLVVVTKAAGHTPQVVGATMLVHADGRIDGTVGGGRFEHVVTGRAREATGPQLVELGLGADLGMCCGGLMEVLITPVTPKDDWLEALEDRGWLSTMLDGSPPGARRITTEQPAELSGRRRFDHAAVVETGAGRTLVERLNPPPRMVIFGAGHVAAPTARIAAMLGYRVVVVDDRPDWNSEQRCPDARRVLEPYEDFLADFRPRPSDALLIVTRGHDWDQVILEAVIDAKVAYLGMIGSTSKVHKSLQKLRARGVPEALIGRLNAPVGISIGALTPEEIAVAIAAEIVQGRRSSSRRGAP